MKFNLLITTSVLMMFALSLTGCHSTASSEEAGSETDAKLEHVIPAHKPKSFSEAVAALESRWAESQEWSDPAQQEFEEIVGWLPELAAQTDLQKDDWDKIHNLASKMKAKINPQALSQSLSPELLQQELEQLKRFAHKAEENDFYKKIHQEDQ